MAQLETFFIRWLKLYQYPTRTAEDRDHDIAILRVIGFLFPRWLSATPAECAKVNPMRSPVTPSAVSLSHRMRWRADMNMGSGRSPGHGVSKHDKGYARAAQMVD